MLPLGKPRPAEPAPHPHRTLPKTSFLRSRPTSIDCPVCTPWPIPHTWRVPRRAGAGWEGLASSAWGHPEGRVFPTQLYFPASAFRTFQFAACSSCQFPPARISIAEIVSAFRSRRPQIAVPPSARRIYFLFSPGSVSQRPICWVWDSSWSSYSWPAIVWRGTTPQGHLLRGPAVPWW